MYGTCKPEPGTELCLQAYGPMATAQAAGSELQILQNPTPQYVCVCVCVCSRCIRDESPPCSHQHSAAARLGCPQLRNQKQAG